MNQDHQFLSEMMTVMAGLTLPTGPRYHSAGSQVCVLIQAVYYLVLSLSKPLVGVLADTVLSTQDVGVKS